MAKPSTPPPTPYVDSRDTTYVDPVVYKDSSSGNVDPAAYRAARSLDEEVGRISQTGNVELATEILAAALPKIEVIKNGTLTPIEKSAAPLMILETVKKAKERHTVDGLIAAVTAPDLATRQKQIADYAQGDPSTNRSEVRPDLVAQAQEQDKVRAGRELAKIYLSGKRPDCALDAAGFLTSIAGDATINAQYGDPTAGKVDETVINAFHMERNNMIATQVAEIMQKHLTGAMSDGEVAFLMQDPAGNLDLKNALRKAMPQLSPEFNKDSAGNKSGLESYDAISDLLMDTTVFDNEGNLNEAALDAALAKFKVEKRGAGGGAASEQEVFESDNQKALLKAKLELQRAEIAKKEGRIAIEMTNAKANAESARLHYRFEKFKRNVNKYGPAVVAALLFGFGIGTLAGNAIGGSILGNILVGASGVAAGVAGGAAVYGIDSISFAKWRNVNAESQAEKTAREAMEDESLKIRRKRMEAQVGGKVLAADTAATMVVEAIGKFYGIAADKVLELVQRGEIQHLRDLQALAVVKP